MLQRGASGNITGPMLNFAQKTAQARAISALQRHDAQQQALPADNGFQSKNWFPTQRRKVQDFLAILCYLCSVTPVRWKLLLWPRNPDDWEVPHVWTETPAGSKTGGRHRQWVDQDGRIRRRWDQSGREAGKERGPHWHDYDDPSNGKRHIDPED